MEAVDSGKIDVDGLIEQGLAMLREDMECHGSFDPTRPYDEKNAYFVRTQELGNSLFRPGLHWVAEHYFGTTLRDILDYEQESGKRFNKGMVYANLGISQVAIGKLDAGIAHLLAADQEDCPFVRDPHGILNTRLWQQFERRRIFDYLIEFNNNPDATLSFAVDADSLDDLFRALDLQDRIFLEGTIWALQDNLQQDGVCSNVYTWGQLYSGLKDLCLLTESLLRKRQIQDRRITNATRITLGNLLQNALAGLGIGYPQDGLSTSANDLQEFVDNLEGILNNANSADLRRVYCLHLVRNFTGHHFDPSDTAISVGGQSFFDMFELALMNILSAILYFKHINAI